MIKALVLLFGIAIGFGVGVYWGVNHPVEAQKLAKEEERRFIEAQQKLLAKVKAKLDQLASANTGNSAGGRGFVSGAQSGSGRADPEAAALRDEAQRQMEEAQKLLNELEKK